MNPIPSLMSFLCQNEGENQWKLFLLRNSLYHFLENNVEFLNSFSLGNNLGNGLNVLPPILQNQIINQNILFNNNNPTFQDETLVSLIQNINESLLQLFNYYQDILHQNPDRASQILNSNLLSFGPNGTQTQNPLDVFKL